VHEPRLRPGTDTWDRGGQNAFSSPIHRSASIDYGVLVEGLRTLLLDDGAHHLEPGDVVVQLGNWHGWANPEAPSLMAFVMMGGEAAAADDGTDR
jgi:quercetin dioxygenase-like cupin family protein